MIRSDTAHGALRGAIGAMAMTGMRAFTVDVGLLERPPPQQIMRERGRALLRAVPAGRRRSLEEVAHWTYGAAGGAFFGLLPESVRRARWAGPAYGVALWLGFEVGLAPALGLSHARRHGAAARLALLADHALYGLVLSEMRERPRR